MERTMINRSYRSGISTKRSAVAVRRPVRATSQRRLLVRVLDSQPVVPHLPSLVTPVHIAADRTRLLWHRRVGTHNHLRRKDAADFGRGCFDAPPTRGH